MIPEENEGGRKRFLYRRKDLTHTKMKCFVKILSEILALFYLDQKGTDALQACLYKLFCCIQFSSE